ncbi:GNAT domain-containing protein [Mycena polygramma]|nr:GNAT domain-containing protein [Mycena polygramma]
MDPVIFTPRLKLTLITKAERGSSEFEWLHELRSDEKVTAWSLAGQSKSFEDTERGAKGYLPNDDKDTYRVAYAVHEILEPAGGEALGQWEKPTKFVGLVNLYSLNANSLALPEKLTLPAAEAATTLTVELAYSLLPNAWGKGYATEALKATFEACKNGTSFWEPYSKVYVRAIVNGRNPASQRVLESPKTGMIEKGIYEWSGKPIFIGGKWAGQDNLHIFGMHLLK